MTNLDEFIYNNGYVTADREEQVEENLRAFVKLVRERYTRIYHDGTDDVDFYMRTNWCCGEAFNEVVKELGLEE